MKVKRILWSLLVVGVFVASVFAFAACGDEVDNADEITVRLIVLNLDNTALLDVSVDTDGAMLSDMFSGLENFSAEVNSFGYLDAVTVNGTELRGTAAEFTFLALYHSIDNIAYKYIGDDVANLQYDGKEYFSSGVGVTQLPLFENQTYVIQLASWA